VRRLLDVLSDAGPRVADPARAAVDATAAGCARAPRVSARPTRGWWPSPLSAPPGTNESSTAGS